jgi:uncharacterized membrane protein
LTTVGIAESPAAAVTAGAADLAAPSPARFDNVDLLRGMIMAVMALDHARDYLTNARIDPTELSSTTPALFLTRWVTHFCAPLFMFLAGVGAGISRARGRTAGSLAAFLVTRGFWLILLEFTVVRFGWQFGFSGATFFLVLWALGVSMICLGGLVFLPHAAIAAISILMIVGHNLLDGVPAAWFGNWAPLWRLLHEPGDFHVLGYYCFVIYSVVPWIGVMAGGYALAPRLLNRSLEARRRLFWIGAGLSGLFLLVRGANIYGDPSRWASQAGAVWTALSFLNTTKYPPSLCFLLMTLGPGIAFLALVDRASGPFARFFVTFGRVPLFFYLLHVYLIHVVAIFVGVLQGFSASAMCHWFPELPQGYGVTLPWVYFGWAVILAILYLPCRWFAEYKRTHRRAWLTYV